MYLSPFTCIKLSLYPVQSVFIRTYHFFINQLPFLFFLSLIPLFQFLMNPFPSGFCLPTPQKLCLLQSPITPPQTIHISTLLNPIVSNQTSFIMDSEDILT